jgi:hypothetical protein
LCNIFCVIFFGYYYCIFFLLYYFCKLVIEMWDKLALHSLTHQTGDIAIVWLTGDKGKGQLISAYYIIKNIETKTQIQDAVIEDIKENEGHSFRLLDGSNRSVILHTSHRAHAIPSHHTPNTPRTTHVTPHSTHALHTHASRTHSHARTTRRHHAHTAHARTHRRTHARTHAHTHTRTHAHTHTRIILAHFTHYSHPLCNRSL